MKWKCISVVVALAVCVAGPVGAAPITVFTSQSAFEASTFATALSIPNSSYFPTSCGDAQTSIGGVVNIAFGSNQASITNASGGAFALCLFDSGVLIPGTNTVPALMIANTIVGNGEDDFVIAFAQPVSSVGFRLLSNMDANERVTFRDGLGGLIALLDISSLTAPNTRQFFGFDSSVPIGSLLIDTVGGAVQNEGFDLLEVGSGAVPVPEPASLLLLASGLLVFGEVSAVRARRKRSVATEPRDL